MTYTKGRSAEEGVEHDDVRLHLFHGAHDPSKLNGVVEIKIYADKDQAKKGDVVTFTTALFTLPTPKSHSPTVPGTSRLLSASLDGRSDPTQARVAF